MKKNRIFSVMVSAIFGLSIIAGCAGANTTVATNISESDNVTTKVEQKQGVTVGATGTKKSIVCTSFPEYDWTRAILGDMQENYELTILLNDGVDFHSYQPTAEDIYQIANAHLVIHVGGVSDEWVEDALKEAVNPEMKVINLIEELGEGVKQEETVEGMESHEHEHEHAEGEDVEHEEHEHAEGEDVEHEEHEHTKVEETADLQSNDVEEEHHHIDEHIWLSLKNAEILVERIADTISEIDSENAGIYKENATAYIEKLQNLDKEYKNVVETAKKDTILFGDRFPFRYLVDDYGIKYYAAFSGCSAEIEASFETVVFLADKVDELDLGTVLVIENSDESIAKTVIENTSEKNQQVGVLNSIQSVTQNNIDEGTSYLQIMTDNLEVLKEALN